LHENDQSECFKWFLASLLFGARIGETIAKNTYFAFVRHRLLSPRRIVAAGWEFLVNPIMREGGYIRYNGRKSTQVLRDCEMLLAQYGGSVLVLHARASDPLDLEARLLEFHGIEPVTANMFLRELRPCWPRGRSASASRGAGRNASALARPRRARSQELCADRGRPRSLAPSRREQASGRGGRMNEGRPRSRALRSARPRG
jgi:hypothetical protein